MKTLCALLFISVSLLEAQTAPLTTQIREPSKAPACVYVFLGGLPFCAVLDPSVTIVQAGGVTTIKAVLASAAAPADVFGETYTATGTAAFYPLLNAPIAGTLRVYLNGLRQTLGVDYSLSGAVVTFFATAAGQTIPAAGDLIVFDYQH